MDVLLITISVFLIAIVYQDTKTRTIHVFLPLVIFILSVLFNIISDNLALDEIIKNIIFIGLNILSLIFYYSIKNKTFINPLHQYLGLGDIVFFLSITPLFKINSFVVFFVLSLLFSLFLYVILLKKKDTIPLAGYMSVFLILSIYIELFLDVNLIFI